MGLGMGLVMGTDVCRQRRKIGRKLQPIDLPEGVECEEVEEYNAAVEEYREKASRLASDPLSVEDFGEFFTDMFDVLRTRALLHRRRADLLENRVGKGAAQRAVDARRLEAIREIERLRGVVTAALAAHDRPADELAGMLRVTDKGWHHIQESELRRVEKQMSRWCADHRNYGGSDRDAADRCEELLREAFAQFLVAEDL